MSFDKNPKLVPIYFEIPAGIAEMTDGEIAYWAADVYKKFVSTVSNSVLKDEKESEL